MTKTRITQRTTNNPTNLPASGVVRFDGNIQAASRGSFAPQLQPIKFTAGGEYMDQMNAIADLGTGIFNATAKVAAASQRAKAAEIDAFLAGTKATDLVETRRIYNENMLEGNDPEQLTVKLEAYKTGKMANMPEEIKPHYAQSFDNQAAVLTVESQNKFFKKAKDDASASLQASKEIIKDDIFENPAPLTEIEVQANQDKMAKYQGALQAQIAHGDITTEEAQLELREFQKEALILGMKTQMKDLTPDQRAAEVKRLQDMKSIPMGLNEQDRQDMVKQLNAYNNDITAVEIKANAAKKSEEDLARSREGAALEIGIVDGVKNRQDVIRAEQEGIITPAKKVQLVKLLAEKDKKEVADGNLIGDTLNAAYNNIGYLDPKNTEHKKGINLTYEKVIKPELEKAPSPAAKKQLITNYVQATGVVPEDLRGEMRATFRGDDVEKKVFYADLIGRLQDVKPQALDDFDDKDIVQGMMIYDMVRTGTPNELAVKKVEDITTGLTASKLELLDGTLNEYWKDKGDKLEQRDAIVNEMADAFDKSWFFQANAKLPQRGKIPFFKDTVTHAGIELALEDDYKNTFKTYYKASNGDERLAKEQTRRVMERDWGVTSINGTSKQLTKYPIEREYAMMDASNKFNFGPSTKWLKKELVADLRKHPGYEDIEPEDIFLEGDDQTGREKSAGQYPSYKVQVFNKKGEFDPYLPPEVRRWYPDVDKYIKQEKPKVIAQHEAQLLKEELSIYNVDPLNPASILLGTLPQKR
jgi:hypothetical protein